GGGPRGGDAGVARVDRAGRGARALGCPPGGLERARPVGGPARVAALAPQGLRRIRGPSVPPLAGGPRGGSAAALGGRRRRVSRAGAAIDGAGAVRRGRLPPPRPVGS